MLNFAPQNKKKYTIMLKNNTNLPQSKVLAAILPIESADMKWFVPADNEGEFVEEVSLIKYKSEYNLFEKVTDWDDTPYIPCWSLTALLDILPDYIGDYSKCLYYDVGKYYCGFMDDGDFMTTVEETSADTPIDACYEMIVKLHEKNLL